MHFLRALFVLPLAFVAASCGGGDSGGTTSGTPADHTVKVTNNRYEPAELTIKKGQTVEWVWQAGTHDVVSGAGCKDDGKFKSAVQTSGTYRFKFDTAGEFPYYCSVSNHCAIGMVGKITVQ